MYCAVHDMASMIQNISQVDAKKRFMSEMGTIIPPHVMILFNTVFSVYTPLLIRIEIGLGGEKHMALMSPLSDFTAISDDIADNRLTVYRNGKFEKYDACEMFIENDDVDTEETYSFIRFVDYITHHHYARRIQRTWRRYRAALKIQIALRPWLDKPMTRDGCVGIRLRIALRDAVSNGIVSNGIVSNGIVSNGRIVSNGIVSNGGILATAEKI
jgi:hypothetical protein